MAFVNLNRWLDLNRKGAEEIGSSIHGEVDKDVDQAQVDQRNVAINNPKGADATASTAKAVGSVGMAGQQQGRAAMLSRSYQNAGGYNLGQRSMDAFLGGNSQALTTGVPQAWGGLKTSLEQAQAAGGARKEQEKLAEEKRLATNKGLLEASKLDQQNDPATVAANTKQGLNQFDNESVGKYSMDNRGVWGQFDPFRTGDAAKFEWYGGDKETYESLTPTEWAQLQAAFYTPTKDLPTGHPLKNVKNMDDHRAAIREMVTRFKQAHGRA